MTLVEELRSKKSRDNRELLDRAADEIDALINAVDNSTKQFLKLHDAYQEQKVEIEALKLANEKMYAANKEQEAEIERLTINMNAYGLTAKRLAEEKTEVAREIFEKIERSKIDVAIERLTFSAIRSEHLDKLKKKYTEDKT